MNSFRWLFQRVSLCCLALMKCTLLSGADVESEGYPYFYKEEQALEPSSPRTGTHFVSLRRSFDNTDFFSAGISSYQGTSTGPGPNGGYPGAPRGVYPTRYVDTSLYPNNYTHQQK